MSEMLWKWVVDRHLSLGPSCERCLQNDGKQRTLAEWRIEGVPPLHKYCHCYLLPIANVGPPKPEADQ